jgi:hypothetical protein
MNIERLMLAQVAAAGRSSAMSRNISWNICRGMATSAIWKAQRHEARARLGAGETQAAIARAYGVHRTMVGRLA